MGKDQGQGISRSVSSGAKEEILQEALKLFAAHGFGGASTRDIARAAGVNHALIKYHFGSKEALWHSAVNWLFARLDDAVKAGREEYAGCDDPVERFRINLRHYIRYCAEHPEHARIMVQESHTGNPRLAWIVDEHISRSRWLEDDLLQGLVDCGALPRMSLIHLRYIFAGVCQTLFTLGPEAELMYGVDVHHKTQIDAHVDAVTKLFLRD